MGYYLFHMISEKATFACFITVRTGSTRLPNKWGLRIKGRRMIEHVIDRTKLIKQTDRIVLCTSTDPSDDILEQIAKENKIDFFRGSLEDKLMRWRDAAEKFNVDYIVTVDGDDPFFGVELIDSAITQMKNNPCDFLNVPAGSICGAAEFCFSAAALNKVCQIKDTNDTEMMWVYFTKTGLFNVRDLDIKDRIYFDKPIRLTLDYIEDFKFFERVFEEFGAVKNDIPLIEIIKLLDQKSEIAEINWFRQTEFLDNQKKKTKLILKSDN